MTRISFIAAMVLFVPAADALAGAEQQAAIKSGCQASTNWSEASCVCITDKAGALTELQQSFLAATLNQQDTAQYAGQMKAPEVLEASMFMMKSGPACQ